MNFDYRLLPECYGDTLLITLLRKEKPLHQSDIGAVARTMKINYHNKIAVGVIDKAKIKSTYFDEFELVQEEHFIQHKNKPDTKHHIIFLTCGLENWLIYAAEKANMNIRQKYSLPTQAKPLGSVLKNINVDRNTKVKHFLNDLLQKNPSPVETLRNMLKGILDD